jgi:hypothetical protein
MAWIMPVCTSSPQQPKEKLMAKKKHTFHCWMRVVAPGEVHVMIPTKPPKKTSTSKPADVVAEFWTGYTGMWNEPGGTQFVLDTGEALYDKKDAVHWIAKTTDGQKWQKAALC